MEEVTHRGKIVGINSCVTEVEILRQDACSSCHARELCGFSTEEKKIVPVPTDAFAFLEVGDEVELCMKASMGMKAVWISYAFPLIILLIALFSLQSLGCTELYSGLGAIAAVAFYYLIIYLYRNKLKNQFVFYIKQKYE